VNFVRRYPAACSADTCSWPSNVFVDTLDAAAEATSAGPTATAEVSSVMVAALAHVQRRSHAARTTVVIEDLRDRARDLRAPAAEYADVRANGATTVKVHR
jgi:hypothetical protein